MGTVMIALVLLLQINSQPTQSARLLGLDRLYFEHLGGPGEAQSSNLRSLDRLGDKFPERYEPLRPPPPPDTTEYHDWEVRARDFPIPTLANGRNLILRQVSFVGTRGDGEMGAHSIDESWWALYDGGVRTDVWYNYFPAHRTPLPHNLRILDVSLSEDGDILVRVLGSYFGSGGFWFIDGLVLHFALTDEGLSLERVEDVFSFNHSDYPQTYGLRIYSEREVNGRIEIRKRGPVPDDLPELKTCGYRHPWEDDHWDSSWVQIEAVARCMTQGPGVEITTHEIDEPSYWERKKEPSR